MNSPALFGRASAIAGYAYTKRYVFCLLSLALSLDSSAVFGRPRFFYRVLQNFGDQGDIFRHTSVMIPLKLVGIHPAIRPSAPTLSRIFGIRTFIYQNSDFSGVRAQSIMLERG